MGEKLGKREKSRLAVVDFGEFPQGCGGALKRNKKDPHGPAQGNRRPKRTSPQQENRSPHTTYRILNNIWF